jgi:hypothetical protein
MTSNHAYCPGAIRPQIKEPTRQRAIDKDIRDEETEGKETKAQRTRKSSTKESWLKRQGTSDVRKPSADFAAVDGIWAKRCVKIPVFGLKRQHFQAVPRKIGSTLVQNGMPCYVMRKRDLFLA